MQEMVRLTAADGLNRDVGGSHDRPSAECARARTLDILGRHVG